MPGKNLRELGGISLVGFKAISAQKSKYCSRLIISTDSPEIQEDARRHGVEVPFTRPAELASDTAKSEDVILHAMEWIEKKENTRYDAIMLLEPSAPFARSSDYDKAVELMMHRKANMVYGMRPVEVPSTLVGKMDEQGCIAEIIEKIQNYSKSTRRQDLEQEYTMNAALYLFGWDFFKTLMGRDKARKSLDDGQKSTYYGHKMESEYSVEIDTMNDWHYAEFLVEKGYVDLSFWK